MSLKESCDATITIENNNAQLLVGATGWCENASVNRPTDRTLNRFGGAGHWSSKQQQFRPFKEVATFKIIKNTKEAKALSLSGAASVKGEVVFVFPTRAMAIGSLAGMTEAFKKLEARGVHIRGIADISCTDISCVGTELVQELLDVGADIRYLDQYHRIYFLVPDRKTRFSVISGEPRRVSLSEPTTMLWTDDRTYAKSLTASFELLWAQAIPAAQQTRSW